MHEGVSSRVKPSRSTSLQEFVPAEVTYSSDDMVVALQEVLSRTFQFHNEIYSELPNSVKFILDNLQAAFIQKHKNLFKKTLQALEIHLVNLTAHNEVYASHYANLVSENKAIKSHLLSYPNVTNEPYTSQLFGKEEIHSMDKKTIMGTNYARLSLKTQSLLRSVVANLSTEIQFSILESKAMFSWTGKSTLGAVSECMKEASISRFIKLTSYDQDPGALYALLKLISKEKVADDGSEDERSSEASISKNPYYPYNQEWFGHDEEDNPNLAED
ncbi:hypothetical protein SO802_034268 [Lithocarpus litseifolius]|uniref:Uncharacterized protein n=1 Tax=Lithocarpus litseifolius TaxID=425828 RepID=A0AAW2BGP9_9ROSI